MPSIIASFIELFFRAGKRPTGRLMPACTILSELLTEVSVTGHRAKGRSSEISHSHPQGAEPCGSIHKVCDDDVRHAFLMLQSSTDLEQVRLQKWIAILLRHAGPDDQVDAPVSSSSVTNVVLLAVPGAWRMRTSPATRTWVSVGVFLSSAAVAIRRRRNFSRSSARGCRRNVSPTLE